MQTRHMIIAAVAIAVIVIGIVIGVGMRAPTAGGSIGVIEISGLIVSPEPVTDDLKEFGDDPSIRAIVLKIDSPGGGAAASHEIYDMVERVHERKPVISTMGSVAASGGYYVALPSDVIVANPGTLTGSIGVIMEWPVLEKLLQKIGIEFETVKSKEHKDIGSSYRRMSDRERQLMQGVVTDVYDQFVAVVAENRNIAVDSVMKYADGRVFTGKQAKDLGFVDTLGSFQTAIDIAAVMVGVDVPHLVYPRKRLSFIDLFTKPVERLMLPRLFFLWR